MAKAIPKKKKAVVAKGKVRRSRIEEDDEAVAEFEKKSLKPTKGEKSGVRKDEVQTTEIVQVWADELQEVYEEFNSRLDRAGAEDKARTLLIELRCHTPTVRISEHEFDVPDCGRHDDEDD